jgi:hypothetical protein
MLFFFNHQLHKGINSKPIQLLLIPFFLFFLFSSSPLLLFSQISQGGQPASFNYLIADGIPEISLPVPAMDGIRNEDEQDEKQGFPRRVGISAKAGIDVMRDGKKEVLPDGTQIWRIKITCEEALAMGLYFDNFHLTEGCRMFVYDESLQFVLGAYTLYNNMQGSLFSTELIPGDRLTLEINAAPGFNELPACSISEISYVYRDLPDFLDKRGPSDDCEVNVNCPEGDNWQYQKHGVARLYVKQNSSYFWCTGALLNNTLQNNEPFLLTANHCAPSASPEDYQQWIFYFNFEAPGCENPALTPTPNTMNGAVKLANANTSGSDFLLLRLAEEVPESYQPYYNGWSIENISSPRGVCIHHPNGDIKKISTYTTPLQSSQWSGTPGTHWLVYWSETVTNWGVTEGGSSGAPLYDNTGKVIGALTGGQAACEPGSGGPGTGPDQPDYYGKLSYSWDQNGSEPSQQLKPWLDPINSGATTLVGKYSKLTAAFQASETLILVGNKVVFTNLSSGLPLLWEWDFEGGTPSSHQGSQPVEVKYTETGMFDVRLIVSDGESYDTLFLKDYIHVVGKVYPNPTSGRVNIFLEEELPANLKVRVYNILGQVVYSEQLTDQSYPLISIDLSTFSSGIYTVRIEIRQRYLFARVLVKH